MKSLKFPQNSIFDRFFIVCCHQLEQTCLTLFVGTLNCKSNKAFGRRHGPLGILEHELEEGDGLEKVHRGAWFHHKDALQIVYNEALELFANTHPLDKHLLNQNLEERLQIGSLDFV